MWHDIKTVIHQKHDFVLTTHVNPDGDGIGSAAALIQLLTGLKKRVRFITDGPINEKYRFLDTTHSFEVYDPEVTDFSGAQVLIVIDANRKERIGRLGSLIDMPGITTLCIDHHPVTIPFTPYIAIDETACSTGAMVYTLYKECGLELDLAAATGIYVSILYDTGRFSYSSTTRKAHKIADECIKIGVDPDAIYSRIFQHVPLAQVKMFALAIQRMETFLDNRIVVQQIKREDFEKIGMDSLDIENIDFEYILEFNKAIEEVEFVVLLRELVDNQVRVSIRSKTNLDISPVTRFFGGGGHSKAGGALVKGSIDDVKRLIVNKLENLISASA